MSIENPGHGPLDYELIRYPGSALQFRGPARDMDVPFVLCLGGAETYGKFIHSPFSTELERRIERPVINMGVMQAGIDLFLNDDAVGAAIDKAEAVVLQITGAQNISNRFYTVHPRRNDRFVKASDLFRTVYRDVDFTEFHFTRHMLGTLQVMSRDRFAIVLDELRNAWLGRMRQFLARVQVPVHLLWISNADPDCEDTVTGLGPDPLFVTREMLNEVACDAASLTLSVTSEQERRHPTKGMFYAPREEQAARLMPGPAVHRRAGFALARALEA